MTMQTNDHRQQILDMQEHPERYTDAQLEAMMDELDREPDTEQAWRDFEHQHNIDRRHPQHRWMQILGRAWWQSRVAAMFIGVAVISGITYATIHQLRQQTEEQSPQPTDAVSNPQTIAESVAPVRFDDVCLDSILTTDAVSNPQTIVESVAPVRFDDVRLDSILTIVSVHYGKTVCFRSEEARAMKLIMTWNSDEPLADFIDGLNMFDGLRLTLQHDTIFVETTKVKEGAE